MHNLYINLKVLTDPLSMKLKLPRKMTKILINLSKITISMESKKNNIKKKGNRETMKIRKFKQELNHLTFRRKDPKKSIIDWVLKKETNELSLEDTMMHQKIHLPKSDILQNKKKRKKKLLLKTSRVQIWKQNQHYINQKEYLMNLLNLNSSSHLHNNNNANKINITNWINHPNAINLRSLIDQ